MSKIISINPAMFSMGKVAAGRHTRKARPDRPGGSRIVVRTPAARDIKTVRRSILKFVRAHQDVRQRGGAKGAAPPADAPADGASEFDQSVQYLSQLSRESAGAKAREEQFRNRTVRAPPDATVFSGGAPVPSYGCLKNGVLPTYREYSRTLKSVPLPESSAGDPYSSRPPPPRERPSPPPAPPAPPALAPPPRSPLLNRGEVVRAVAKREGARLERRRGGAVKKIITRRRTFRAGRARHAPSIAVLISNRTVRSGISTKAQLLKSAPIQDVRRFLIKQGFIRVGSTTPNDVLRQMYESVMMMCGEVRNHSPDTLLYNFLNAGPGADA